MEIKKGTRQQNHATTAKRLQMVEQYRRSGLTRAAFSRQHRIPLATLNWWLAKTKRASNLPVPVVFSEVMLPPAPAAATSPWAIEFVRPDGLIIRCREAFCANDLVRLLPGRGPQC
jgi:transposase-like protein